MLKAFGDTKLVGQIVKSCPNPAQTGKQLTMTEWKSIKDKRNFSLLLYWILPNVTTSLTAGTINPYHDTRNALYHQSSPLSVEQKQFEDYLGLARQALADLFAVSFDEKGWQMKKRNVGNSLFRGQQPRMVLFSATEDGLVKVETNVVLKNTEAIQAAIHGLGKKLGRPPTTDELEKSLNYSGYHVDQLESQVSQLRKRRVITKAKLALKPSGRRRLFKKFGIL
jgi:chaperonin cofactor prefoldin